MLITVKIFHEKSSANMSEYDALWEENRNRFIFLQTSIAVKHQQSLIKDDIEENNHKDILAVRFPTNMFMMKKNKIINDVMNGKGFTYDTNKIWYPKEVWIYSPIN